jgi:hypothetical protein
VPYGNRDKALPEDCEKTKNQQSGLGLTCHVHQCPSFIKNLGLLTAVIQALRDLVSVTLIILLILVFFICKMGVVILLDLFISKWYLWMVLHIISHY